MTRFWAHHGTRVAALYGALGVALGAFAAHGLREHFAERVGTEEWWKTAVFYHLTHTLALAFATLEARRGARGAGLAATLFAFGILVFSGSLYLLALTEVRTWGAVTPIGGSALIAAWLILAFSKTRNQTDTTQ